jgi:hypothetical protein
MSASRSEDMGKYDRPGNTKATIKKIDSEISKIAKTVAAKATS